MKRFYVDSCIWLNLFKKEGDESKGVPYWKIAKSFLKKVALSENAEVLYTSFILKEINRKIQDSSLFRKHLGFMRSSKRFIFIDCLKEDYILARKLESESGFSISFIDCINVAICMRLNAVLVTRDRNLIDFALSHIDVGKPEYLTV
jgi:predicted nucleic acid-binding protein